MLAFFSEGEFLNTVSKIQEKKKEVAFVCSRPPKNVINKALSRRSRATTADWKVQKSVMDEQSCCIAIILSILTKILVVSLLSIYS